jgi:4-amino-4-deoxy-L-arabinose transferase-like glycosyltransferase
MCSGLVLAAILIRLYMVYASAVISNDGILYVDVAKAIARGDWVTVTKEGFYNLYPFLIVLLHKIVPDWELAGRLVSLLLGSAAVIPLFFLFERFLGLKAALLAGLFYAIHPKFVEYSSDVLREASFWCFALFALWLGRGAMLPRRWALILPVALMVDLAIFTRLEGLVIALVIPAWIVWFVWLGDGQWKKAALLLALFIFVLPLFASPAFLFIKEKTGRWESGQTVSKAWMLLSAQNEGHAELATGKSPEASAVSDNQLSTNRYLVYLVEVSHKFVKALGVVLFPLLVLGVLSRRSRPWSREEGAVVLWCAIVFVSCVVYGATQGYFGTRHGLSLALPTLGWCGRGFWELEGYVRKFLARKKPGSFSLTVAGTILFLVLLVLLPQDFLSSRSDKADLRKAGLCLRESGYRGQRFATEPRLTRVGFYGDLNMTFIPEGLPFEKAVKLAREDGSQFFLIDERTTAYSPEERRKAEERGTVVKIPCPAIDNLRDYSMVIYHITSR